jgi:hypothetical protein
MIFANLIGLVGFLILLYATQHKGKQRFLAIDAVGSVVVGIQWILLGATSAALLNGIFLLADSLALLPPKWRRAYPIVYPLTLMVSAISWNGAINIFVALAGLLAFAGRQQETMFRLRWLIIGMALSFLVVGVLAGSWAQIAFSVFYVVANLRQLYFVQPVT